LEESPLYNGDLYADLNRLIALGHVAGLKKLTIRGEKIIDTELHETPSSYESKLRATQMVAEK